MPKPTTASPAPQALAAVGEQRPDAATAMRIARRTWMRCERVDMQTIAAELGVDRTTLYRWLGNRDEALGKVMWSLAEPTYRNALAGMTKTGPLGIAQVMGRFTEANINAESLKAFLRREPERALRLLTTKASILQREVLGVVEQLLKQEQDRGNLSHPMPLHDLAYLIVRIMESFIYTDLITGEPPDAGKAETAIAALLGAPWTQDGGPAPEPRGGASGAPRPAGP